MTIDDTSLATVFGGQLAPAHGDLLGRLGGSNDKQLAQWDACLKRANADLNSGDPTRVAAGQAVRCTDLLATGAAAP